MKIRALITSMIFVVACSGPGPGKQQQDSLLKQIREVLKSTSISGVCDEHKAALIEFISKNCDRLFLLSRDTENTTSALAEANDFFFNSATLGECRRDGLKELSETMSPHLRSLTILENELWLLNDCALSCKGYSATLKTVSEQ